MQLISTLAQIDSKAHELKDDLQNSTFVALRTRSANSERVSRTFVRAPGFGGGRFVDGARSIRTQNRLHCNYGTVDCVTEECRASRPDLWTGEEGACRDRLNFALTLSLGLDPNGVMAERTTSDPENNRVDYD